MSQRRRKKNLRRNLVLGAFLLVTLLGLTILTQRLGPFSFRERRDWTAHFGERSLVEEGAAVYTSGLKIGFVKSVSRVPDQQIERGKYIRIVVSIDSELTLWEGAKVVLAQRSLLGRTAVEIDRGDPGGKRLDPGQPLPGEVGGGLLGQLSDVVEENREDIATATSRLAEILDRLATGKGTLGKFLNDDSLYRNLESIGRRLDEILADVQSPKSSVGLLLREREMYDELRGAIASLREITDGVQAGKGTIGRLFADEGLANKLDETVTSLRNSAQRLEKGEGTLGKLLTDEAVHEELLATVKSLRSFADRIESGEGTFAKLMQDDAVYENLRILSENLRLVSEDVRAGKGTLGLLLKDEGVYNELQRMLESFRESGDIARENAPLSSLTSFTSLFFNVLN